MENKENTIVLLAEEVAIDEKRSNDIFLLISFKLFDNSGNRNREGVTAAFISEIMNHREKYAALPIYVDVKALLEGRFSQLGHNYDPQTGRFNTEQIGGLVGFTMSVNDAGVVSLYAEARIPKRESEICERLEELFVMGGLNVSFEVKYNPENTFMKDGVRFVDAGEGNTLTGMCIVSTPACPDANALDMVAEVVNAEETTETNEVNEEVPNEELNVTAEVETDNTEAVVEQPATATAEVAEAAHAEAEVAEAEIVHEEVEIKESVTVDPFDGKTYHETKTEHTVVETIDEETAPAPETVIAEQPAEITAECGDDPRDKRIAELEAELARVTAELKVFQDAKMAAELQAKQAKAKAFAQKQGLNLEDEAVANAVAELNYEAIAELAMASEQKEEETPAAPAPVVEVTMASFVDMDISDDGDEYGGLLKRKNRD